jgi:hypothetical protein
MTEKKLILERKKRTMKVLNLLCPEASQPKATSEYAHDVAIF